jgi:TonB-dependent SusC/RagA subfamily outer membrane receptor
MLPFTVRPLLSLGLCVATVAACAHSQAPHAPSSAPKRTASVTSSDIDRAPGEPLEKILAGRVAGVVVTRAPDGGLAVRIRGTSTVSANAEPLFVIDGVPIEPGPGGSLFGINPYDVERIEVLKDAASTTMYGVRGANGVILVQTKRPTQ